MDFIDHFRKITVFDTFDYQLGSSEPSCKVNPEGTQEVPVYNEEIEFELNIRNIMIDEDEEGD